MLPNDRPILHAADLTGCTTMPGLSSTQIAAAFVGALQGAGATVVEVVAHDFPGAGLTCVLILAESHAVLHTWPETGTVHVDVFSCSSRLASRAAIQALGQSFGATQVSVQEIPRASRQLPPTD